MLNKIAKFYILTFATFLIVLNSFCMNKDKSNKTKQNALNTALKLLEAINNSNVVTKEGVQVPPKQFVPSITKSPVSLTRPLTIIRTLGLTETLQKDDTKQNQPNNSPNKTNVTTATKLQTKSTVEKTEQPAQNTAETKSQPTSNQSSSRLLASREVKELTEIKTPENFLPIHQTNITAFSVEKPFHEMYIIKYGIQFKLVEESFSQEGGKARAEAFYVSVDEDGNFELPGNHGDSSNCLKTFVISDDVNPQKPETNQCVNIGLLSQTEKFVIDSKNQVYSFPHNFDKTSPYKISWKDPNFNPEHLKHKLSMEPSVTNTGKNHVNKTSNSNTKQQEQNTMPTTNHKTKKSIISKTNNTQSNSNSGEFKFEQAMQRKSNQENKTFCSEKIVKGKNGQPGVIITGNKNVSVSMEFLDVVKGIGWVGKKLKSWAEKRKASLESLSIVDRIKRIGLSEKTIDEYEENVRDPLFNEAFDQEIDNLTQEYREFCYSPQETRKLMLESLQKRIDDLKCVVNATLATRDARFRSAFFSIIKRDHVIQHLADGEESFARAKAKFCAAQALFEFEKSQIYEDSLMEAASQVNTNEKVPEAETKKEIESENKQTRETIEKKEAKSESKQIAETIEEQEKEKVFSRDIEYKCGTKTISISEKEIMANAHRSAKEIFEKNQQRKEKSGFKNGNLTTQENSEPYSQRQKTYNNQIAVAAENDVKNGNVFSVKKYALNKEFEKVIAKKGYNAEKFKALYGNESQKVTQDHIIETSNLIFLDNNLTDDFKSVSCDFLNTATNLNAIGGTKKANIIVDFCNGLTDATKFVMDSQKALTEIRNKILTRASRGIASGANNTALMLNFLRNHPKEAFNAILNDLSKTTKKIGKLCLDYCDFLDQTDIENIIVRGIDDEKLIGTTKYFNETVNIVSKSLINYVKTHDIYDIVEDSFAKGAEFLSFKVFIGRFAGYCNSAIPATLVGSMPIVGRAACAEDIRNAASRGFSEGIYENIFNEALVEDASVLNQNCIHMVETSPGLFEPVLEESFAAPSLPNPVGKSAGITPSSKVVANPTSTTTVSHKPMVKPVIGEPIKGSKCSIPTTKKMKNEYIRKFYVGFSEEQANALLEKTGKNITIADKIVRVISAGGDTKEVEQLLKALNKRGFTGIDKAQFDTKSLRHIFGIEYNIREFKDGRKMIEKAGGHFMRKELKLKDIEIQGNKSIEGKIYNIDKKGHFVAKQKTVFPQEWSELVITEKIRESFLNITTLKICSSERLLITGITKCGIKIATLIDKQGIIITSYIVN